MLCCVALCCGACGPNYSETLLNILKATVEVTRSNFSLFIAFVWFNVFCSECLDVVFCSPAKSAALRRDDQRPRTQLKVFCWFVPLRNVHFFVLNKFSCWCEAHEGTCRYRGGREGRLSMQMVTDEVTFVTCFKLTCGAWLWPVNV